MIQCLSIYWTTPIARKKRWWEKQNVSIESFRNSREGNPLPLAERRSLSLEDGLRSKSLRRPRRGHTYGAPWAITRHRLIDCLDWRSSVDVTKSRCIMFEADAKRLIVDIVLSRFKSGCYQNLVLSSVKRSVKSSVKSSPVSTSSLSAPQFGSHTPGRCGRWGREPEEVVFVILSSRDLIQPSSSSWRTAKYQSSWNTAWLEGSEERQGG